MNDGELDDGAETLEITLEPGEYHVSLELALTSGSYSEVHFDATFIEWDDVNGSLEGAHLDPVALEANIEEEVSLSLHPLWQLLETMGPDVYVGARESEIVHRLGPDGEENTDGWPLEWPSEIWSLDHDGDDSLYLAGDGDVARINAADSDDWFWNNDTMGLVNNLALDAEGNAYATRDTANDMQKIDPDSGAAEEWGGGNFRGVTVDPDGYAFGGTYDDGQGDDGAVHQINPDGIVEWNTETFHTGHIRDLEVDSAGHIYTASEDFFAKKIDVAVAGHSTDPPDPADDLVGEFDAGAELHDIAVGPEGAVYLAADDGTVHRLDSSMSPVEFGEWPFDNHASTVHSVAVDRYGFVYSGDADGVVHKIAPDGSPVTSGDWPFVHPGEARIWGLVTSQGRYPIHWQENE